MLLIAQEQEQQKKQLRPGPRGVKRSAQLTPTLPLPDVVCFLTFAGTADWLPSGMHEKRQSNSKFITTNHHTEAARV